MTKFFIPAALALLVATTPAAALANGLEGHWENPKHTTIVNVSRCDGEYYCAIVLKASAKAQANARKGGTTHFIGTEILHVRSVGDGVFKGTAFDPESNMHVDATVHMVAPGIMELKGCAIMGLICQEQRWTKAD
ncbi:MAG TPA: DUF2147 domain-containing protein [Sphingomicrobium sp.]|nr:DUF2147 domain-containing protein [Sphingomicrobium sp.]